MNLKRLFRLAVISGAVAAAVAAIRALTRNADPLPAPAAGPSEPWPPLRAATTEGATSAAPASEDTGPSAPDEVEPPTDHAATELVEEEVDVDAADEEPAATTRRRQRPLRAPWMPPKDDGSCPDGYPLKANDHSMIFHAPGQMSYDRTVPERCYADADAAVADGYRAAKR